MKTASRKGVWDVSKCKRDRNGDYILSRKMHPPKRSEPKDYRDISGKAVIMSIGENKRTGQVVASTSGRFYQNKNWTCRWLR